MNRPIELMLFLDNSLIKKEYLILLIFLLFAIILTVLIIGASYFLAKQNPDLEKLSAYECGFEVRLVRIINVEVIQSFNRKLLEPNQFT